MLNAGQPTNYDNSYIDLMRTYRDAARTAMSIADAAGIAPPHPNAVAKSWRVAVRLESALWVYKGQHPDPRPLIATMTREFESLTKRFDEGHLKSKEAAAECRMANMLVEDVLSHGAYELLESARRHIIAYSDITTPPWTTEPPGVRHARWYICGGKSHEAAAQLTTCVECNDISRRAHYHPPARPVMEVAQPVSEVWWIRRSETPTTPRPYRAGAGATRHDGTKARSGTDER
jgi:hypothetical protein